MALGSLVYVGRSRLRRLRKEKRQERIIEKEIKRKEKKTLLSELPSPGFPHRIQYSLLHDEDNDSGIDPEEESFDRLSIESSDIDPFFCGAPDFGDIDLRPKPIKLGFNYVDFQKFSKMPFGPFKKKQPEAEKIEEIGEEATAKTEKKGGNINTSMADEEKTEAPAEEAPKAEEAPAAETPAEETKAETTEEKTEEKPAEKEAEANGEAKVEEKMEKLDMNEKGKQEGSPLLQSEAAAPGMLCCTIL